MVVKSDTVSKETRKFVESILVLDNNFGEVFADRILIASFMNDVIQNTGQKQSAQLVSGFSADHKTLMTHCCDRFPEG